MKIAVDINRDIFGKKKGYVTSFGQFKEYGQTKEEAKQKLIEALNWYFDDLEYRYSEQDTYRVFPNYGYTFILKRNFDGYTVLTLHHKTNSLFGCSKIGRLKWNEALNYFEKFVKDYIEALEMEE